MSMALVFIFGLNPTVVVLKLFQYADSASSAHCLNPTVVVLKLGKPLALSRSVLSSQSNRSGFETL